MSAVEGKDQIWIRDVGRTFDAPSRDGKVGPWLFDKVLKSAMNLWPTRECGSCGIDFGQGMLGKTAT